MLWALLPVIGQHSLGQNEPPLLVTLEVICPLEQPTLHVGFGLGGRCGSTSSSGTGRRRACCSTTGPSSLDHHFGHFARFSTSLLGFSPQRKTDFATKKKNTFTPLKANNKSLFPPRKPLPAHGIHTQSMPPKSDKNRARNIILGKVPFSH